MWIATLACFFALTSAVIIHVANKEIRRRDMKWSELIKEREKLARDKDRAVDTWTRDYFKLQDKISGIKRENINLVNQLADAARKAIVLEPVNVSTACVICLEPAHLMACIPCGHRTSCQMCVQYMDVSMCPICRQSGKFYQIYDSAAQEADGYLKKDLPTEEIVKRKGIVRRFIDNLKTSANKKHI